MSIEIPIKTTLQQPTGFDALAKAAQKAEREAIASTRRQIAEHKKVVALTKQLDREMAGGKKGSGLAGVIGGQIVAANALRDLTAAGKDFVAQSLQMAAAEERLGHATDSLSARYGVAGESIVDSIQEVSQHTITRAAAMQQANQAMLLGVARNEEEFERLTKVAIALGRAMGQDAGKSVEDLTIGIGRQSRLILDNLGLMVSAETAYVKYALAVGKSAEDLTEAEKKQAFLNETLEQGEKKIATMGDIQLDAAGKMERLTASYQDFQASAGKLASDGGVIEATSGLFESLDKGAQAWSTNIEQADLFAKALDRMAAKEGEADLKAKHFLENIPIFGQVVKIGEFFGAAATQGDDFAAALMEITQEQADAEAVADAAARAMQLEEEAMAAAAEAAAVLAEHLKLVVAAQRDVAGSMIDITEKAAADTLKVNEDFAKEDAKLLADHAEANTKIQADSEKDRKQSAKQLAKDLTDVGKDLAKDLAKVDKELAKDKAKLDKDTNKQIARLQQDAAREEKQQRRARLIDARGDERLFQFDMRQLAAEGSFNAIQEAMGRRAIEKQIEEEKLKEEQAATEQEGKIQIDRIRQDAAERKQEMEAEAEERRQELQIAAEEKTALLNEQAAEEEVRRQEELAQALADEQASYDERQAALVEARDEKLAAIEEGKQAAIAKLAEELVETGDLTKEELEKLVPLAGEFGEDAGKAFADGLSSGFARNERIDSMLAGLGSGGGGAGSSGNNNPGGKAMPGKKGKPVGHPGAFAGGGAFTVGGSGGTDSELVSFWATPGERVTVQTPAQQGGITVNVNGIGGADLAAIVRRRVEQAVEEYHSTVIVPWAQG
jgi:hypothetical protein